MAGIYIHIPYCKKRCVYCDFHFKISQKDKSEMINSIKLELLENINYFKNKDVPKLPITGGDLIRDYGIPEGAMVGEKLKEIENVSINNSFKISDKNLKKILKN